MERCLGLFLSWSCPNFAECVTYQRASLCLGPPPPPQLDGFQSQESKELNTEVLAVIPLAREIRSPVSLLGCVDINHVECVASDPRVASCSSKMNKPKFMASRLISVAATGS